jgi:hypothetical protein
MPNLTDVEFIAWFAGAVDGGWEPLDGGQWRSDDEWVRLLPKTPPLSALVADLARTASSMHEAVLALAFASDEDQPADLVASCVVMARSAIECLATGLWLCLPKEPDERARRYLTLGFQDMSDLLGFNGGQRSPLPKEGARLLADLGFDVKAHVSTTEIISAVDVALGTDTLRSWRIYSGVAHGRPWAREVLRQLSPESGSRGTDAGRAIGVLSPAVILARTLLEVADLRRRFPGPSELEAERLQRIREAT